MRKEVDEVLDEKGREDENQDAPRGQNEAAEQQADAADAAFAEATSGTADNEGGADTLRGELEAAQSQILRAQADFENYRKRIQREQTLERQYAALPLLRDLLPVVDNIHRAIDAAEQSDDSASLLEGFKMVAQQIETVFSQHDCKPIEAEDQQFDPNLHEAISQLPSPEPRGAIIEVTQSGYTLHDRVVRPSQVVVSAGPPEEAS